MRDETSTNTAYSITYSYFTQLLQRHNFKYSGSPVSEYYQDRMVMKVLSYFYKSLVGGICLFLIYKEIEFAARCYECLKTEVVQYSITSSILLDTRVESSFKLNPQLIYNDNLRNVQQLHPSGHSKSNLHMLDEIVMIQHSHPLLHDLPYIIL